MWEAFFNHQLLVLITIVFAGYALGHIKVWGISLGNSACLFVAMAAGALGAQMSPIVADLGIIFFVYAVGLIAGPQFFRLFRRRGLKFSALGLFTIFLAAVITILFAIPLKVDTGVAAGAFAGAMTSTPALASAVDAVMTYLPGQSGSPSIGYAVTYPFGLISQILFVQLIAICWGGRIQADREREKKNKENFGLKTKKFRLTNRNLAGKTIEELDLPSFCRVNLTRFKHVDKIGLCRPETRFELNDIIVAVGTDGELHKFKLLVGEEVSVDLPLEAGTEIRDIFVSGPKIVGQSLSELKLRDTYGVTVSRIYRGDVAITPTSSVILETGDLIRVVGTEEQIERFIKVAGSEKRRLDDTNILILALGMLIGVLIGEVTLKIGDLTFKLGLAGGPLFVALILGHFGKIGRLSTRVPNATKFFLRDIGLVFFLTGVGIKAGQQILPIISQQNIVSILILGAAISLITLFASYFLIHKVLAVPIASSLGATCGAMTSSPALGALIRSTEDDSPTLSYAAVYPVAVIILTIFAKILVVAGMGILH